MAGLSGLLGRAGLAGAAWLTSRRLGRLLRRARLTGLRCAGRLAPLLAFLLLRAGRRLALRAWRGVILLGFPVAAALSAKATHQGFLEIFLSAFGVILLSNLVDWLILDWLIICTITPKFVVLPGTEGMAGYKNYAMHFRGFLIGTALSVVVGLIIAGIVVFV